VVIAGCLAIPDLAGAGFRDIVDFPVKAVTRDFAGYRGTAGLVDHLDIQDSVGYLVIAGSVEPERLGTQGFAGCRDTVDFLLLVPEHPGIAGIVGIVDYRVIPDTVD
jgi:hypothetical protein